MNVANILLIVADAAHRCADVLRSAKKTGLQTAGPLGALEALRYCAMTVPAVAVIDVVLRDITGPELCQLLRRRPKTRHVPILLFNSQRPDNAPPSEALAFADDFVAGREMETLPTHVQRLLDSSEAAEDAGAPLDAYHGRHLRANFERVHIAVDGKRVDLTRRELSLLQFLVTHRNHVLTRSDLLQHVWDGQNDGRSRTVDVHVRRLRRKLGAVGTQIQTIPSVGYRFNEDQPQ